MSHLEIKVDEIGDGSLLREALERDGAVVIKDVLSADEIAAARKVVRTYLEADGTRLMLGRTQPNAAAALPELDFLFSHPRIVAIYKRIYGDENVMFTGHCDAHMNMISGWHKDSGELTGGYFKGDYFTSPECQVYKVAIYLQDTAKNDGLTVGLRSHRNPRMHGGEAMKLTTRVGDLVVFDVRLDHVGRTPNAVERVLKNVSRVVNFGDRNKQDPAIITSLAGSFARSFGRVDRLSIFFTFGPRNHFTEQFAKANILRQRKQSSKSLNDVRPELTKALEEQGIAVFKLGGAPAAATIGA